MVPAIVTFVAVPEGAKLGDRLLITGATTPTPVSGITDGTPLELLAMVIAPGFWPAVLGANVTEMVQVPPIGNGDEETQLSVSG